MRVLSPGSSWGRGEEIEEQRGEERHPETMQVKTMLYKMCAPLVVYVSRL